MKKLNDKRQTPQQDIDLCVEAEIDERVSGSQCKTRVNDIEIALGDAANEVEDDQDFLNLVFQVFCSPECGNVFLEAYEDCGVFDVTPRFREFFIGICGNYRGTPCYSFFDSAINASIDTTLCYFDYQQTQMCQCEDELRTAVESQGCCLTVYQDFFQAIATSREDAYNLDEVYGYCNVSNPGDCNNSPLGASGVACSMFAVATAVLLALVSAN